MMASPWLEYPLLRQLDDRYGSQGLAIISDGDGNDGEPLAAVPIIQLAEERVLHGAWTAVGAEEVQEHGAPLQFRERYRAAIYGARGEARRRVTDRRRGGADRLPREDGEHHDRQQG